MRLTLTSLVFLTAFSASATLVSPLPTAPVGACPTALVTDHLYRWQGPDLTVPADKLGRLTVRLRTKGFRSWWGRPERVEIRFDGELLATVGYGDDDSVSAYGTLIGRYAEHDRYQRHWDEVLRNTFLAWNLELARARFAAKPLTLRLKSIGSGPVEKIFGSPVSDGITLDRREVPSLNVTWIGGNDEGYTGMGPTVLVRHGRTALFAQRVANRWVAADLVKSLRADIAYAVAKDLPIAFRVSAVAPLTFQVDSPAR